jgi:hypothetical protein
VTAGRIDQANLRIGYVRGAGVVMDSRRTLRALVVVSVLVLATLTIVLTREAINANARISRLRQHGVPVDVTVTSCLGLASGSGITEAGYRCRGTFTLDGHHYNEVIAGTTDLRGAGETLHAVADPSDPAILSTADVLATTHPIWTAFISPAIPMLLLLPLLVLARRLRRKPPPSSATTPRRRAVVGQDPRPTTRTSGA